MTLYYCLIPFVGNTGTGKSSLIEVLIGHFWDSRITDRDLRDVAGCMESMRTAYCRSVLTTELFPSRIAARIAVSVTRMFVVLKIRLTMTGADDIFYL